MRSKHHLPNAYEILLTQYDRFRTGLGHFQQIFQKEGGVAYQTLLVSEKTRVITLSCCTKISEVHHLLWSQDTHLTDGRMDGQNLDSDTVRCITCSCTVII